MGSTVAIVGGGYGGAALARQLDPDFDVVLIDPRDAFVHAVAALRGLVDADWAQRIYFGYEGLFTRGRHLRDRAVEVDAGGVTTAAWHPGRRGLRGPRHRLLVPLPGQARH